MTDSDEMTESDDMDDANEMSLCIPGPWSGEPDLMARLLKGGRGFKMADGILENTKTGYQCEIVFQEKDPDVIEFFSNAPEWAGSKEMKEIERHESVVMLFGESGSREACEELMKCAAALIQAGGLGIFVDNACIAHKPHEWLEYCDHLEEGAAHAALVVYLDGDDQILSCGMQSLGHRDAIIAHGEDEEKAIEILQMFTFYLFSENPEITDGDSFSLETDDEIVRIKSLPEPLMGADDICINPQGAWQLVPEFEY